MHNILKLAALIVVAAIGAFIIRALFIAASAPGALKPAALVHVRVAADELPDGLLLRDSDLIWKAVPHDKVPPGALVEGSPDANANNDLKGDLLRHAVHAGTPLGLADVILPSAPGFLAAALKPGMRAISVSVDDVSGNAGLIQPGDFVDVLLTQQIRADAGVSVPPGRAEPGRVEDPLPLQLEHLGRGVLGSEQGRLGAPPGAWLPVGAHVQSM